LARDAFSPPHRLCDGDRIRIGQTTFQVEVYQDAAAVEAGTNAPAGEPALVG
jgi:predicted component of type VI protein secretion system